MDEGYLRPEQFVFSTTIGALVSLLLTAAIRPTETEGRYTMVHLDGEHELAAREIVGHSQGEFATALALMESSIELGEKARISICTEVLPTEDELSDIHLGMLLTGCHVSYPTARLIKGIPTTQFTIEKGSPQWQIIIPLLVPIFTIGLIAFGIAKIETITKALVPLILITIGGLIVLAVALRKPVEKYIERGGKIPLLASTSKKALAAR